MTEEELRSAVATLDLARAQLDGLAKQGELLRMALEEHMRAKETISRFNKTKTGERLLVPVGADCFVFAAVENNEDVIVSLGSDVMITDTTGDAIAKLDKRIKQMNDSEEELAKRMAELDGEVARLTEKVQSEYDEYRSQE
ncbi:MAG: prefoldin subunit alpha [Thermoplasmata archaeon]|nr:prefoldin subunit alpha [Thermoplasmata archaeon]